MGRGDLPIDEKFRISYSGSDSRIKLAAEHLLQRTAKRTGIAFAGQAGGGLAIVCRNAGKPVQQLGEDESYRLNVTPQGATLTASNPLGVLRGMATFEQLIARTPQGFAAPAVNIDDSPRFPWRGLHLDVSRHWMPVEVVKRNIDAMSAVKLNVFHWHLSDNQGFRIESETYPKLQGDGSDGHFYTKAQVRDVIAFARDRGIRVVPEFDIPGHSTSWLTGYPELAAAPGPFKLDRTWGVFDPAMDPTADFTYIFLDRFIREMAELFPDEYFHIGGDEVNGKEWSASGRITAFKQAHGMLPKTGTPSKEALKESNEKLQAYFNQRVQELVKKHGKKMMGWDEILAPTLPKDIVIQSWRGQESLAQAVQQGFQGILSSGYYLDHMDSAGVHYSVDPLVDPKTKKPLDLTADQKKLILGGEVCMWSEYVSPEIVDSRIWPRTAAMAERFWSPQGVTDTKDMYARLDLVSEQLDAFGVTHHSSYLPMLQRLAGSGNVEPLRVLADVVHPVPFGTRFRSHPYTQETPLDRFVDTVRPESVVAQHFGLLIDQADWPAVRQLLTGWKNNPKPALAEVAPVSEALTQAATIGLEAVDFIQTHRHPPQAWVTQATQTLANAKKAKAETILAAADPIRRIVDIANQ
jgi:hexosaminidase